MQEISGKLIQVAFLLVPLIDKLKKKKRKKLFLKAVHSFNLNQEVLRILIAHSKWKSTNQMENIFLREGYISFQFSGRFG